MHETLQQQLVFRQADHYNLPLVKRFYKSNGFRAQAPKDEPIFIALLENNIIAALRLSPLGEHHLLRSMCVAVDYRNQGVGSALLRYLQNELNQLSCYSFPFEHLESFYRSAGFELIAPSDSPEPLRDKFNRYINSGKRLCLMKHHQQGVVE